MGIGYLVGGVLSLGSRQHLVIIDSHQRRSEAVYAQPGVLGVAVRLKTGF